MRANDARHNCPRQTLNEVLVAEISCLRPDLIGRPDGQDGPSIASPGSQGPSANPDQEVHLTAATYADCEADRIRNLSNIYRQIGSWSQRTRKGQPGYAPLSALCLSGGGIRSATFNLGVLQSLARIQLLGKFDYLSSVSGGGYIASWLRAWMQRRGVPDVVTELGSGARGCNPLATEPKPVSNLREYSNYLTPKLGLF
jgi:Patatin-like phospholipase